MFIFVVGHLRETVEIINFKLVSTGLFAVTLTNDQKMWTEGDAFCVADTLHHWETGNLDLTFIFYLEGVFEGKGPRGLNHGRSFVGL